MSNSAKAMTECTTALTTLVEALHRLMADVERIGNDVTELKISIAGINGRLDTFATKEDLHKQTWRIYGAMATLMAVFYFLVRYVH